MALVLLYVPCPTLSGAKKIADALLGSRLIACANIMKSSSLYRWGAKRRAGTEYVIFAKTSKRKAKAAKKAVKRLHSYKIPCILSLPVKANRAYETWAGKEVK